MLARASGALACPLGREHPNTISPRVGSLLGRDLSVHIAIDDTTGPAGPTNSSNVTGPRRSRDEGKKKSNRRFERWLFRDRKRYSGYYAASIQEPLLQIADMMAFCINRVTHLSLKEHRTASDEEFLSMVTSMRIRSEDLSNIVLARDFTVEEIDMFHTMDRLRMGLEKPT